MEFDAPGLVGLIGRLAVVTGEPSCRLRTFCVPRDAFDDPKSNGGRSAHFIEVCV